MIDGMQLQSRCRNPFIIVALLSDHQRATDRSPDAGDGRSKQYINRAYMSYYNGRRQVSLGVMHGLLVTVD